MNLMLANIVFRSVLAVENSIAADDGYEWARDPPDRSGRDTDFSRGFVRLIRYLCLNESKQALVLLRCSKELEGNTTRAHRTNHPGHFNRELSFVKRQLQIEDVVRMDLGLAFDDTAAHREI